jgi:uncharacterized protein
VSVSRAHSALITLGVTDLRRSIAFYEALGLQRAAFDSPSIAVFEMGGAALSLCGWDALAESADLPAQGMGFRGVSLAWRRPDRAAVDASLVHALACGARLVKPATEIVRGGYSGYFADPDEHLWEVVHHPGWPLRENGAGDPPPPAA